MVALLRLLDTPQVHRWLLAHLQGLQPALVLPRYRAELQGFPTPDYSQSYRPPSLPSLATQGMAAAPTSSPQTQSFDKLTEAIVQGQDIQQKQLTALNGILNAVQVMAEHLANKKLNENSQQPPTKEPAP